MASETKWRN